MCDTPQVRGCAYLVLTYRHTMVLDRIRRDTGKVVGRTVRPVQERDMEREREIPGYTGTGTAVSGMTHGHGVRYVRCARWVAPDAVSGPCSGHGSALTSEVCRMQ